MKNLFASDRMEPYNEIGLIFNRAYFVKGLREEVNLMCNLSEGIEERAMERGRKDGINTVLRLAEKCHLSKEETIQQLCEGMKMEVAEAEKYYEEYRKDVQTSL